MSGFPSLLLTGRAIDADRLMGGHLPLAVVLDVDFERQNAVGLLVLHLDVDEAAQLNFGVTVREGLVMAGLQDGIDILLLRLGLAVRMRVAEIVRQKALEAG